MDGESAAILGPAEDDEEAELQWDVESVKHLVKALKGMHAEMAELKRKLADIKSHPSPQSPAKRRP